CPSPPLPLPVRPLDDKTLGGGNWFGLIDAFPEAVGSGGSVRQHVGEHMESVFPDFRQICHGGHRPHLYRNAKRAPHTSIRGTNFMEDLPGLPDQSALTPANFTTLPHFSVSSASNLPKSAGEPGSAVAPNSASRTFILGSARPALISLLSLSTILAGVFFGAPMPVQKLDS